MQSVLIDANVLIGCLDSADERHSRALEGLNAVSGTLMTTWPVVDEASHVLGHRGWDYQNSLLEMIEVGSLGIAPLTKADASRMRTLMSKYRDQPMDLADASLVRVAERDGIDTIVTLDRDFRIYRAEGIGALKIFPKP